MLPLDASANFTNVTVDASWSPDDLSSEWDPSCTSRSPTAANRPMCCRFARSSDDSGNLPADFPAQMLRWRRRSGFPPAACSHRVPAMSLIQLRKVGSGVSRRSPGATRVDCVCCCCLGRGQRRGLGIRRRSSSLRLRCHALRDHARDGIRRHPSGADRGASARRPAGASRPTSAVRARSSRAGLPSHARRRHTRARRRHTEHLRRARRHPNRKKSLSRTSSGAAERRLHSPERQRVRVAVRCLDDEHRRPLPRGLAVLRNEGGRRRRQN